MNCNFKKIKEVNTEKFYLSLLTGKQLFGRLNYEKTYIAALQFESEFKSKTLLIYNNFALLLLKGFTKDNYIFKIAITPLFKQDCYNIFSDFYILDNSLISYLNDNIKFDLQQIINKDLTFNFYNKFYNTKIKFCQYFEKINCKTNKKYIQNTIDKEFLYFILNNKEKKRIYYFYNYFIIIKYKNNFYATIYNFQEMTMNNYVKLDKKTIKKNDNLKEIIFEKKIGLYTVSEEIGDKTKELYIHDDFLIVLKNENLENNIVYNKLPIIKF